MVNSANVGFFGSGTSITLPEQFFGGPINTQIVQNTVRGNLFPRTTRDEAVSGIDKYLCVYFKNLHSSEAMNNVVAWLDHNTPSEDSVLRIGKGFFGRNGTEQRVTNIFTEPTGIAWFDADSYESGVALGRYRAGDWIGIWHWLHVRPNSKPVPIPDHAGLMITFDPPAGVTTDGGTGGTSGGGTPPPSGGGSNTPPVTLADFKFTSASDYGCSSEMKKTLSGMLTFSPDWIFSSGDFSYSDSGDCFVSNFGNSITKLRFCPGNHERAEGVPSDLIKEYSAATGMVFPNAENEEYYSSMTYKNVFIIFCDQYADYEEGSQQFQFIQSQLNTQKNNDNIDWRIVRFHEPMYSASSKHGNLKDFRDIYHPIFDANLVDFCENGHNHNEQISYPLRYNSSNPSSPTIHSTGTPDYTNPDGIIFITNGVGGRDLYSMSNNPAWNVYQNKEFGFLVWTISNNGKTMTIAYYTNAGLSQKYVTSVTKS